MFAEKTVLRIPEPTPVPPEVARTMPCIAAIELALHKTGQAVPLGDGLRAAQEVYLRGTHSGH